MFRASSMKRTDARWFRTLEHAEPPVFLRACASTACSWTSCPLQTPDGVLKGHHIKAELAAPPGVMPMVEQVLRRPPVGLLPASNHRTVKVNGDDKAKPNHLFYLLRKVRWDKTWRLYRKNVAEPIPLISQIRRKPWEPHHRTRKYLPTANACVMMRGMCLKGVSVKISHDRVVSQGQFTPGRSKSPSITEVETIGLKNRASDICIKLMKDQNILSVQSCVLPSSHAENNRWSQ